jgi:AAA domain (dynein-related subfamily)
MMAAPMPEWMLMGDYFTEQHFNLLREWADHKRDPNDPANAAANLELKRAYDVTARWAQALQEKLFPGRKHEVRRDPASQNQKYLGYNWGRIYPRRDSPSALAYTVGISGEAGFEVKLDLVDVRLEDPRMREAFDRLCVNSRLYTVLPMAEGLAMTLDELVAWSAAQILGFRPGYEEVAAQLGLIGQPPAAPAAVSMPISTPQLTAAARAFLDLPTPANAIFYGPPGTGKTYSLQQVLLARYTTATQQATAAEQAQDAIATQIATLSWWEGIAAALYDRGGHASVSELLEHPYIQAIARTRERRDNVRQTLWSALQLHAIEDSTTIKMRQRSAPALFDKRADSSWQFAGEWREECADLIALVERLRSGTPAVAEPIRRYAFATFHQSYGYEEFVEGLRPRLGENAELGYELRRGAFRQLCDRARADPDHRYAMVIDEINRGNVSRIFGELITLIEADKRETLCAELSYSRDPFSVPANVDILGSMNTADRSLALLDTALRRRFDFIAVPADTRDEPGAPLQGLVIAHPGGEIDVRLLLAAINARIAVLYDREHVIGHAYFTPLRNASDAGVALRQLGDIFRRRVLPLLEEYFFDDWQKIRLVLGDDDAANAFIVERPSDAAALRRLFGGRLDADAYPARPRYHLNDSAFSDAAAYRRIYASIATGT